MVTNATHLAQLVKFVESIAFDTVPFVKLQVSKSNGSILVVFESVPGVRYALQGRLNITDPWSANLATVTAIGVRTEVSLPNDAPTRFLRLVQAP